LFFIIIPLEVLLGCAIVAVPMPNRSNDPYPEDKLSIIVPQRATRSLVEEIFGEPSVCRLGTRIYIYAAGQRDWTWYGFAGVYNTGDFFSHSTYLTHLLIIEFDKNDIVSTIQEFCGESGEIEDGLYVQNSGSTRNGGVWGFSERQLILHARPISDKKAKRFIAPINKSVIYYYKNFSDICKPTLDSDLSTDSGRDGFLAWVVEPGEHTIGIYEASYSESLIIHCYPGETYFVGHSKGSLKLEQRSIGENEILKRKLVIDRLDAVDLD
jgi:hypothetical protein